MVGQYPKENRGNNFQIFDSARLRRYWPISVLFDPPPQFAFCRPSRTAVQLITENPSRLNKQLFDDQFGTFFLPIFYVLSRSIVHSIRYVVNLHN
jgi:hypothetical protein